MALDEYRRKRNFDLTSEPPAQVGTSASGRSFVVQKHAARRLHYDFRLELDGVLKSWSVPKGPSFDPSAKRLAVQVEDHPIGYGGFEGIIPAGQYGGGTVLLWDRGTWSPVGDPGKGLSDGHLKLDLFGQKLHGRWALVRMKPRPTGGRDDGRSWLLIKDRDQHARPESAWSVTQARPESVASGRDMPEIAAASDRVWHSDRSGTDPSQVEGARPSPMPERIVPANARRGRTVPDGDGWLHEIAIDGERIMARIEAGTVRLLGEGGSERTQALAALVPAVQALPAGDAFIDCLATAFDPDGHSSSRRPPEALYAIDLLYLDGYDLTRTPLLARKALLASLIGETKKPRDGGARLHYADHVLGRGRETFTQACALEAAGIVSKKGDSRYPPPKTAWRVVPCPTARKSAKQKPRAEAGPSGVRLTHPERVLYPEVGITKLALAEFYETVAERILPYLVDRPLTLIRAPDGMTGQRFYVRHTGDWTPSELRRIDIKEGTGSGTAMVVDDLRGLVALAQMNVLEIHPWNARTGDLEKADRIVFDLDPGPEVAWADVIQGAKHVRDVLATVDLASFVKTTGGKGLHVVVPLQPAASWDEALEFSRLIAQGMARFEPSRFSAGLAKAPRTSKIFIDYLRNRRGATAVSAYSTRAQPTATVSVPQDWRTLDQVKAPDAFHIRNLEAWYPPADPWKGYGQTRQRLTAAKLKAASAAVEHPGR